MQGNGNDGHRWRSLPLKSQRRREILSIVLCTLFISSGAFSQVTHFPYTQNFDTVLPPGLPPGWTSSHMKSAASNDFVTIASTPRSSPNAVLATNATLPQTLASPQCNFTGQAPSLISFFIRRSATFGASLVVEASTDGGSSFPLPVGDTIKATVSTSYTLFRLNLPLELTNQSSVIFRWRVLPASVGNAGTLRIDDVTIEVQAVHDLALRAITCTPAHPVARSYVDVSFLVLNEGSGPVQSLAVSLYEDTDADSLIQESELRGSASAESVLDPGDSVELTVRLGPLAPGEHALIGRVSCSSDRDPENDSQYAVLHVGFSPSSLIINEIMYAPSGGEPEWVELLNPGGEPVDLTGWMVSDEAIMSKHLITKKKVLVPPGEYALLTKDTTALLETHPIARSPVLEVAGFPSLSNSGDAVVLYDNTMFSIDSVCYSPSWGGGSGGKSLERVDPTGESAQRLNWGTSRAQGGSTPDMRNSIARKENDLAIDTVVVIPMRKRAGDLITVQVRVENMGIRIATGFNLLLYLDANDDSLFQPAELVCRVTEAAPLPAAGSIEVAGQFYAIHAGKHLLAAKVFSDADEDTSNNSMVSTLVIGNVQGSVLINEIMYAPSPGTPEWVELSNAGGEAVSLGNWRIGNRSLRYPFGAIAAILPPHALLIVTKDTALFRQAYGVIPGNVLQLSSLPTFSWGNSGDAVVVEDVAGEVMDSVYYRPGWSTIAGASLERVDTGVPGSDSTNWSSSQDSMHATPGRPNSVVALDFDLKVSGAQTVSFRPGEPSTLPIVVINAGKKSGGSYALLLYSDANSDSIATPVELSVRIDISQSILPQDSMCVPVRWEGMAPGCQAIIAFVDYPADQRPANNRRIFSICIPFPERSLSINEIMFAPFVQEAEYVEFINISSGEIDVAKWSLSDLPQPGGTANRFMLSQKPAMIRAGDYFLLASDSSIFRRFPDLRVDGLARMTVVQQNSLGLNNDGDAVVLRDPSGRTIDSVAFLPSWHNPAVADCTGRSLERIHPSLRSDDPRSWNTCVYPAGGSPLRRNSIYAATLPAKAALSFSPNPFSPDGDGHDDFVIIHYDLPIQTSIMSIKIFDVGGRLIRRLVNAEPCGTHGEIVWDGLDEFKQVARIGPYIILCEAINEGGGIILRTKEIVVLAKRL